MTFLGSMFGLKLILMRSPFIGFRLRSSLIVHLNFLDELVNDVSFQFCHAVPNSIFWSRMKSGTLVESCPFPSDGVACLDMQEKNFLPLLGFR